MISADRAAVEQVDAAKACMLFALGLGLVASLRSGQ